MNILRWRRKSKNKIKFKTIVLFIFSLIMTTFAWFAYSRVLDPALNIHISAWDMEYSINGVKKTNPIGIEIPILYPSMEEEIITIDIKNNGDRDVDIDYYIQSLSILGETYQLIQEGTPIPQGTENYIVLTQTALEKISTTDEVTGITTVTKTVKGAITNDITRLPFTIEIEHSAEIYALEVDNYGNKTPGLGYLNVIVNWIGDNHELDSEWGYRVNEYLTTTGATSAISLNLVVDSYQIEEETEIAVTMPKTAETAPYLPEGFVRVPGTTLETGLVIKDSLGNEYVWVEVPKNTTVYKEAGLNLNLNSTDETYLETAYVDIETDLKEYSEEYRYREEAFSTYTALGISKDVYDYNKTAMLKSIYNNGGFYIGRYETGIKEASRTANSSTLQTAVIKPNVYPYNYVTIPQAQSLADGFTRGTDYTSCLMYGLQWDLALKYIDDKTDVEATDLNTDSTILGNYYENIHYVTNEKAQYSLNSGSTWTESPYEKAEPDEMLLTTGANTTFSKQNIYDIAGNLAEWTYNVVYQGSNPIGGNGGDYSEVGIPVSNSCGNYKTTEGSKYVGFRVVLFSNIHDGAEGIDGGTIPVSSYMPTGFREVARATATTGYTIKDESQNEYVWIEVPRNTTVYDRIGTELELDSMNETELATACGEIEKELQEYAEDYRSPDSYKDKWLSEEAQGIESETEYNKLKNTMLKSVYKNEGFYIGKYETGTFNARNSPEDALTTAVIQQNAYPYNYVTNAQAQEIATGMPSGQYTSSLMFGIQWDLVLKYLEETDSATQAELKGGDGIGSRDWGNYMDSTYEITNTSAKFWIDSTNGWQDRAYGKKEEDERVILSTGADSRFSKKGIYDLAGNVGEWTLEQCISRFDLPSIFRGGNSYNSGWYYTVSNHTANSINTVNIIYGFRVTLF